ncbi:MAG: nucleotide exchange factor GrpE [Candidatus Methanomethylophilaceae archaeon]|nr:nucleotide exchange factor GrpE [Candidatus Methanomethylophilaceae archaeon]
MSDYNFKNFLSGSFQNKNTPEPESHDGVSIRVPTDQELHDQGIQVNDAPPAQNAPGTSVEDTLNELKRQIAGLQSTVESLRASAGPSQDMSEYMTSREQIKALQATIERQNIEITNKALVSSMEQIAIMREDFFKLCAGMEKKIDTMSAKDVLASFKAYEVDMENILHDGGVEIGHFPYDTLNTIHQRIVEVVPTNDQSKNGQIAERLSDGYKLGDRVLLKEKVTVYKYTENMPQEIAQETPEVSQPVAEEQPKAAEEAPVKPATKTTSKKKRTTKAKAKKTEEEE